MKLSNKSVAVRVAAGKLIFQEGPITIELLAEPTMENAKEIQQISTRLFSFQAGFEELIVNGLSEGHRYWILREDGDPKIYLCRYTSGYYGFIAYEGGYKNLEDWEANPRSRNQKYIKYFKKAGLLE